MLIRALDVGPAIHRPAGNAFKNHNLASATGGQGREDEILTHASKAAAVYLDAIVSRKSDSFDEEWMQQTFDAYWDSAQRVTHWAESQ